MYRLPRLDYPSVPTLEDVRRFIAEGSQLPVSRVIEANTNRPAFVDGVYVTILEVRDDRVGFETKTRRNNYTELLGKPREIRNALDPVTGHLRNLRGLLSPYGSFGFSIGDRDFSFSGLTTSIRSTYVTIASLIEQIIRTNPDLFDIHVFFSGERFHVRSPRGGSLSPFFYPGSGIDVTGDDYLGLAEGSRTGEQVQVVVRNGDMRYDYVFQRSAMISVQFYRNGKDYAQAFSTWLGSERALSLQRILNFNITGDGSIINGDMINDERWEGRTVMTLNVNYIDELRQDVGRIDSVRINRQLASQDQQIPSEAEFPVSNIPATSETSSNFLSF